MADRRSFPRSSAIDWIEYNPDGYTKVCWRGSNQTYDFDVPEYEWQALLELDAHGGSVGHRIATSWKTLYTI